MRDEKVITVLIVDDHPVVREGLRAVLSLEADMQVVVEIGTGEDALAVIPEFRSAVVLMDLLLPDISGVEVIRRICATSADIAFLVLSTHIRKYDDVLFASIR